VRQCASILAVPVWDADITVDEALARALIKRRFPALDAGSLRPVGAGWDNVVWATADGVAFRFPRRRIAVPGVEREIALLPALAPRLPLAIPDAAYAGAPSVRYPWPWFGSRLVPGREIAATRPDDAARVALASRLGAFLRTLHDVDLPGAAELPPDPWDRTHMAVRVPRTREALAGAARLWTAPRQVDELLAEAERLPAPEPSVLVHGDLHVRHVLVDETGLPTGVIDWGDLCRADPSADLSLYWSLLPPAGRDAFLAAYGPVEEHMLLRARVLALFLCATLATYAHAQALRVLEREALDGLARTLVP
jgi:aminoglycoside phosphotransferase (APT) family kinase protein